MSTLKSGYYWIRQGDEWSIAEWDSEFDWWCVMGNDETFDVSEFDEIGPKIERITK